jgi:type III secretory pathway component EscS
LKIIDVNTHLLFTDKRISLYDIVFLLEKNQHSIIVYFHYIRTFNSYVSAVFNSQQVYKRVLGKMTRVQNAPITFMNEKRRVSEGLMLWLEKLDCMDLILTSNTSIVIDLWWRPRLITVVTASTTIQEYTEMSGVKLFQLLIIFCTWGFYSRLLMHFQMIEVTRDYHGMYIRVWNNDSENGNSLYMVFVPNLWLNKTRQNKRFSRQWCPCCIVNSNIMTHSFPLHFNVFRYIPMVIKISFHFFRIVLLMILKHDLSSIDNSHSVFTILK